MNRPLCPTCGESRNAAEYITDDERRFAWSESNAQYEEVPEDGGIFTLLRERLEDARADVERYKATLIKIRDMPSGAKANLTQCMREVANDALRGLSGEKDA